MEKEWENEVDEMDFVYRGIDCYIWRNRHLGFLCGYCIVPKDHPWEEQDYGEIECDVYGGVTFKDKLHHKAHDERTWIGFDCGHIEDLMPFYWEMDGNPQNSYEWEVTYKNIEFVKKEIKSMVDQMLEKKNEMDRDKKTGA